MIRRIRHSESALRRYDLLDAAAAVKLPTYPDNFKQAFIKNAEWWIPNRPRWLEACLNGIIAGK